ncbi:MAG: protoporphyrinogen oxidase [Bacteroidota bacterium]
MTGFHRTHRPVIILGGGISGLATAYYLKKKGVDVTLLEKEKQAGGVIRSEFQYGCMLEFGPNTMRDKHGNIAAIASDIGLEEDLIEISEAFKTRYVVQNRELSALSSHPLSIFYSRLLSLSGKWSILKELFKRTTPPREESVGTFIERRFGKEITSKLAEPLFKGIYACDLYQLDKDFVLPEVSTFEQTYGSVLKGFMKEKRNSPSPTVLSFRNGLQQLPHTLSQWLNPHIEHQKACSITKQGDGYAIETDTTSFTADHVISTLPAYVLEHVIDDAFTELKTHLNRISYTPILSVQLIYKELHSQTQKGFGFLVPSTERLSLMGAIWRDQIFPDMYSNGYRVFNLLIHGDQVKQENNTESEVSVIDRVIDEFKDIMNINENPDYVLHRYWENAIPRYEVGHKRWIDELENISSQLKGFHVGGNYRWGASIADCVEGAHKLSNALTPKAFQNVTFAASSHNLHINS